MEIAMTQPNVEQSIEQQYEQGPGVSDMDIPQGQQPMTPEQATEFLNNTLPLMRLQCEYDKLMIEQMTNDGLLGRRPIAQIPGLLGLELKRREIEVQQFLAQYTARLTDQYNEQQQKELLQKQESLKTGIESQLVYNGDNPGEIMAFVKGTPLEEAQSIVLDLTDNPEKRVSISVPDSNYKTGQRAIIMLPSDSIVKCNDGSIWSMTDTEINVSAK